jgi:uncharacterized protein YndB with AHSA1/START domain
MRTMAMSIVIDCPAAAAFAALSDARTQPQWDPGLVEARHDPEGSARLGTKITEVRQFMGRTMVTESELVEFGPNKRLVRQGGDPMLGRVTGVISLDETPSGTRVDWTWYLEMPGLKSLLEPVMAAMMRRQAQGMLANLKGLLEGERLRQARRNICSVIETAILGASSP